MSKAFAKMLKERYPWLGTADGDPTIYPTSGADVIESLELWYTELQFTPEEFKTWGPIPAPTIEEVNSIRMQGQHMNVAILTGLFRDDSLRDAFAEKVAPNEAFLIGIEIGMRLQAQRGSR